MSHHWMLQPATLRVARIFSLAMTAIFAVSVWASPASAVTLTPYQESREQAGCKGSPTFECTCFFAKPTGNTKRHITHASIGAELPIGTRVLQVYLKWAYNEGGTEARHYLTQIRETFVPSGQFFSASGQMFARSWTGEQPQIVVRFDSLTPVGTKFDCTIEGYTEKP